MESTVTTKKNTTMEERNEQIRAYYNDGERSLAEVGRKFGLKRQRVQQILKKLGAWKPHKPSGRTEHLGVTVKPETKHALEELAGDASVSRLASDVLDDYVEEKMTAEAAKE